MAQNPPLILKLLASSVTVAARAGKIIRDVMSKGDLGVVEKGKNDLQTEADRSAQSCIVTSLARQFPNVTIIGEESIGNNYELKNDWIVTDSDSAVLSAQCPQDLLDVSSQDVVVWVDPLDGTSEYTQGLLEHVTVLVGISVQGKSIGGVIHQPFYKINEDTMGRTIWGLVGLGVEGFSPQELPSEGLIVTTTRSHSNNLVQQALSSLNPTEVLKVGGAGYKVLLLIEGKAHAYVFASKGCKKWDTCAPEAILTALGGKLTDFHGSHYAYGKTVGFPNSGGVFATAKGIDHDSLLKKIPEDIKNTLI